jgi:2'-5' RNA ligase
VRLFVAVELDEAAMTQAASLQTELRRRTAAFPSAKLTWVDPRRAHLTVRFIGEVPAETVSGIRKALTSPIPVAPFRLACQGLLAIPSPRRPRVIACGIGDGREALSQVETVVSARLGAAGIPRESRPYRPHLTLARLRDSGDLRIADLFAGLENATVGVVHVEATILFESRLSSKGPAYFPLARVPLAA